MDNYRSRESLGPKIYILLGACALCRAAHLFILNTEYFADGSAGASDAPDGCTRAGSD